MRNTGLDNRETAGKSLFILLSAGKASECGEFDRRSADQYRFFAGPQNNLKENC